MTVHKAKRLPVENFDELETYFDSRPERSLLSVEADAFADLNGIQAEFAEPALIAYAKRVGEMGEPMDTVFGDLLGCLHHLADALGVDWDHVVQSGEKYYDQEIHGVL